MIKVISDGKFNTSRGTSYLISDPPRVHVGETIEIDGEICTIKKIVMPSVPNDDKVALFI